MSAAANVPLLNSNFSKPVALTVLPPATSWKVPAGPSLMVVPSHDAAITAVSVPAPPSSVSLPPPPTTRSLPLPPLMTLALASAGQRVAIPRAGQVLEVGQGIGACAASVLRRRSPEVRRYARGRAGVARRVVAAAAVERIVARAADQDVVARPSRQHIAPRPSRSDSRCATAYRPPRRRRWPSRSRG